MNLLNTLKALIEKERKVNLEILRGLDEAESTKLFARAGFESLHEFCVRELDYTDGAADRRIKTMRLMREHPIVEMKLESGELNLTTASMIQRMFMLAKKQGAALNKEEIIETISRVSSRNAEKILRVRAYDAGMKVKKPDESLREKVRKIIAHHSHKYPGITEDGMLHVLVDQELARIDHARKRRGSGAGVAVHDEQSRYIPAHLKRKVFVRDGNRCTYLTHSGRRCEATHFLQTDHIIPVALGGLTKLSNLRLLCRTHNQLAADDAGLHRPRPNSGAGAGNETASKPVYH